MRKIVAGIFLMMGTYSAYGMSKVPIVVSVGIIVDDEYEQFRKQGDELFKAGQYSKALNKYLSCLEVPGFERDRYIIERVSVCKRAVALKSEVMGSLDKMLDALNTSSPLSSKNKLEKDSLFIGQFERVLPSFQVLMTLNPDDASMGELAFTYWSAKGNQAMREAKGYYEKALEYKLDGSIDKKLKESEKVLASYKVLQNTSAQIDENGSTKTVTNTDSNQELKKDVVYVGGLVNGYYQGEGSITYANGDKYVGNFKDGLRSGKGTLTYANGDKYIGYFKDNVKDGKGTLFLGVGIKYVGDFKKDKPNGQGRFTHPSGFEYNGEFLDGYYHGKGVLTDANGQTKYGYFVKGEYVGDKNIP